MFSPRSGFRAGGARARYALAASSPGPPPATADASWSRCAGEDDSGRPRLDDQETTHQDNATADEQQERQRSWSSSTARTVENKGKAFQLGAPAATCSRSAARAQLGEQDFAKALAEGRLMTLDQVLTVGEPAETFAPGREESHQFHER